LTKCEPFIKEEGPVNLTRKRQRVISNAPESDDCVSDPDIKIREEQFKQKIKRQKTDDYSEMYKLDDSSTIFAGFSSPNKEESYHSGEVKSSRDHSSTTKHRE